MKKMAENSNAPSPEEAEAARDEPERTAPTPPKEPESKKDQILSLYLSGVDDIEDLALLTDARPSYVGSVLRDEGLVSDYFDLYTSTQHPMNVYSKYFAGQLGFKDEETARRSIERIDRFYHQFSQIGDRAGQHHAFMMALVMFNRARWTDKRAEAEVFRHWLIDRLEEAAPPEADEHETEQPAPPSDG